MPSEREGIAMLLADTVAFGGFNEGIRGYEKAEHAWVVRFKKAGVLEGAIYVYNPHSMNVQWKTPTKRGAETYRRPAQVIEFFRKYMK